MDYDIVAAMVEDEGRESTQISEPDAPPSPQSTSPPGTPSVSRSGPRPASSASPSTPQGSFQGIRRIKLKLNVSSSSSINKHPWLTCPKLSPKKALDGLDEPPQIKFIPSPNSNIARNYNDLPWSLRMQKYIEENKKLLAELVAAESEGYKARLVLECFPSHKWVDFEYEADDSQEPLNDMLHLNFQLRIRCQAVKLMKREASSGIYASGHEYQMRMFGMYKVFGTFP
jgi:hypothetical protein